MGSTALIIEGTPVRFLVDSGAARSVLRPCDLPCKSELSNKIHESISATGHTTIEKCTEPLTCETEGGRVFKHTFLFAKSCPTPLLSRDLICHLRLILTLTSSGTGVTEGEEMYENKKVL